MLRRGARGRSRRSSTPGSRSATRTSRNGGTARRSTTSRSTLALKPDYDLAVINIAHGLSPARRRRGGAGGVRALPDARSEDAYVRYQMGEIWLDRGDLDRAEELFRAGARDRRHVAAAKNALGVDRASSAATWRRPNGWSARRSPLQAGRPAGALQPGADRRGSAATCRPPSASTSRSSKLHPESYKAAFNLSRLYEQIGERELEIDALKQSIDGNPDFADGHFFLAKAYLDARRQPGRGRQPRAEGARARRPTSEMAPLGHYVLADIYNRQGRPAEAAREAALGRALEGRARGAAR